MPSSKKETISSAEILFFSTKSTFCKISVESSKYFASIALLNPFPAKANSFALAVTEEFGISLRFDKEASGIQPLISSSEKAPYL